MLKIIFLKTLKLSSFITASHTKYFYQIAEEFRPNSRDNVHEAVKIYDMWRVILLIKMYIFFHSKYILSL